MAFIALSASGTELYCGVRKHHEYAVLHVNILCNTLGEAAICFSRCLNFSFSLFVIQVRIMFEVQDLRYATLATVSRCGMVWFSEDIVSTEMIFSNFLTELKTKPIEEFEEDVGLRRPTKKGEDNALSPAMQVLLI